MAPAAEQGVKQIVQNEQTFSFAAELTDVGNGRLNSDRTERWGPYAHVVYDSREQKRQRGLMRPRKLMVRPPPSPELTSYLRGGGGSGGIRVVLLHQEQQGGRLCREIREDFMVKRGPSSLPSRDSCI